MKSKLVFLLLAAVLLTPWPVAYAYDNSMTAGDAPVQVEAAGAAAAPQLHGYGSAIGSVTAGDLFYVDAGDCTADMPFTLYLTNTDELVSQYRYLTLEIGVYADTGDGGWERLSGQEADTYITMHGGYAEVMLPGYARYKITIERGCFYCYGTGESAVMPQFYLSMG